MPAAPVPAGSPAIGGRRARLARFVLACLIAAVALVPAAQAGSSIVLTPTADSQLLNAAVSYLEDRDGSLKIHEVASLDPSRFTPLRDGTANFGFSRSAYWLRFVIERDPADRRVWNLQVGYPLLDSVELYAPAAAGGGFIRRQAGDHLPFAQREQLDPKFYFQLQALAGAQTYFLRVQSQSSVTVPLELLTDQAAERTRAFERLFYGLFYGALLALGMYNLLLLVSTRDRLYLFYILFATAAGVAQFAYNGLAYELLWPDAVQWNDRTPNFFGLLALALGILFTRTVLDTRATAPRLDVALRALAVTSAALGILSLGPLSYATSVRAFSTLGPICAAAMLGTGILCALRGYRVARYFLLAWSVLLLGVIVHSLRVLGIVPTHLVTVHAIQIGAGLEMLLLSFALADRINTFKREKEAAQATALETSRQYERELESKVEMRVADLAALNQALEAEIAERRKAEEMLTRMAHHDPLTGLPNRLLLRDRFAVASANARRNETGLALLLLDLDGFKQVNDTFGHDAGDRLLTNVGEALRTCVRESDTVARLGGDEFVVLAGNLGELEQEAMLVAQKIIERLSVPTLIAGNYVVVGPSIGISLFPRDGADLDTILKCADHAMYEAKQSGGKTLRFCTREMAQQYQLGLQ